MTTHECACPYCDETTADLTQWSIGEDDLPYCPDCQDYATTEDGEVLCATHDIPTDIDWGTIHTGQPGAANWQMGRDSAGELWAREDRGGWTVPVPATESATAAEADERELGDDYRDEGGGSALTPRPTP